MNDVSARPSIVVSGSFRQHFDGVRETVQRFELLGLTVLSPTPSSVASVKDGFAILDTDDTTDVRTLETRHLRAISQATGLYVFDPEGYVGLSTSVEVGWALAMQKPVFAFRMMNDVTLGSMCGPRGSDAPIVVATPEHAADILTRRGRDERQTLRRSWPLDKLQAYVAQAAKERGFADETLPEIVVLMTEELGELARQVRKISGMKTDRNSAMSTLALGHEVADLLFYLLHLSNIAAIDLFDALARVEHENAKREWVPLPRESR